MTSWIMTWRDGVQYEGPSATDLLDQLSKNMWIAHWESMGGGDVKTQLAERCGVDRERNDQDFVIQLAEVGAISLFIMSEPGPGIT